MNQGIRKFFSDVPHTYELVNHVLTFGLDILWRRSSAKTAAADGGQTWLDMCSGTGEMAMYLRRLIDIETTIVAVDFSFPMLSKITEKPEGDHIRFTMADARCLPFPDNSIDLVTISFATRNINISRDILIQTLAEFHRILKPGGRFVNLETSQPQVKSIRFLYHTYVRLFVKPIGSIISGSKSPYAYLSRTIRGFYNADDFAGIIRQAGFSTVTYKRMFLGIAAVHKAVK